MTKLTGKSALGIRRFFIFSPDVALCHWLNCLRLHGSDTVCASLSQSGVRRYAAGLRNIALRWSSLALPSAFCCGARVVLVLLKRRSS